MFGYQYKYEESFSDNFLILPGKMTYGRGKRVAGLNPIRGKHFGDEPPGFCF